MFNFKDIDALHSVLKAIYQAQPGPGGVELLSNFLQEKLQFTREQATDYSTSVLTRNSDGSADFVHQNAWRLVGKWSKGSSPGSAGNLVVTRTDSTLPTNLNTRATKGTFPRLVGGTPDRGRHRPSVSGPQAIFRHLRFQ